MFRHKHKWKVEGSERRFVTSNEDDSYVKTSTRLYLKCAKCKERAGELIEERMQNPAKDLPPVPGDLYAKYGLKLVDNKFYTTEE